MDRIELAEDVAKCGLLPRADAGSKFTTNQESLPVLQSLPRSVASRPWRHPAWYFVKPLSTLRTRLARQSVHHVMFTHAHMIRWNGC